MRWKPASTSPALCRLVEAALAGSFLNQLPERVIGDKADDGGPLDAQPREGG